MTINNIEDCFYEKRINTALRGYNDQYSFWISDFHCFQQCLKGDFMNCRSFEYWYRRSPGLCVLTNVSSKDYPSLIEHGASTNYYEINCQNENKTLRPSEISCPNEKLHVYVELNNVNPHFVLLGDNNCKPNWKNETHVQFTTHIDNCSLILTNDSIIGKLHWRANEGDVKRLREYERFFVCPSNIQQRRLTENLHYPTGNDHNNTHSSNLKLYWKIQDHSDICLTSCLLPLYSFINVTIDKISSDFLIDSCHLQPIHPYTKSVHLKRLIYHGCPFDPSAIHMSKTYFSFHLYQIIKEPISFQIHCHIIDNIDQIKSRFNHDCSLLSNNESVHAKKSDSTKLYSSPSINVTRKIPNSKREHHIHYGQKHFSSIATVQSLSSILLLFFISQLFLT